ncbi:AbrB/MazE/SpoVT family DNA-binding domain-containing protein [Siminovitchia terrae]|uniref:AbrB/MazE/SpoVT family DNA-binding domain-containing protein n=1 Tax=Siminovitchia terrae TaxID=1914933 RepID=A0A429X8H6_SIMTE|nr:AbrB/MazE/SpoVT family DNA-binding domain-containing protein [Siminovitchia terrae]
MKAIGIVRRIDDLGRVVIPKEIRKTMKWGTGTPVEFFVDGESIVLKKYHTAEEEKNLIELLKELEANTQDNVVRSVVGKTIQFIEGA